MAAYERRGPGHIPHSGIENEDRSRIHSFVEMEEVAIILLAGRQSRDISISGLKKLNLQGVDFGLETRVTAWRDLLVLSCCSQAKTQVQEGNVTPYLKGVVLRRRRISQLKTRMITPACVISHLDSRDFVTALR